MVDFTDVAAVTEVGRRHRVDGVLTVSADRAVPVVAAVAEALGLPGIGNETAHRMTHKLATWIDQFGTSGCVGCGRCITWCPVAIDITEEVAAIRAGDLREGLDADG